MDADSNVLKYGKSDRLVWIDALRVMACFGVVSLHVVAPVLNYLFNTRLSLWWTANIVMILIASCVALFVMISGSLFLERPCHKNASGFLLRRVRFFLQIVFWTILYIIIRFVSEPAFSSKQLLADLWRGVPYYHLWFLYMIAGLYLVTPFLCGYVRMVSRPVRTFIIFALFIIASCWFLAGELQPRWQKQSILVLFVPFIPYYLLGYELKKVVSDRKIGWFSLGMFFLSGAILLLTVFLLAGKAGKWGIIHWFFGSFSPFVLLMAICLFYFMYTLNQNRLLTILARLSPLTLGIYVLHPFFIRFLGEVGFPGTLFNPNLAVVLLMITVFSWSALTAWAMIKIPYIRGLVTGSR
ncbi:MAG: acyltransferase family protein [Kiritimatiellae bacterium]|nr:acyltransferase family protein [Kiritimatiellia bacterium]MDD5520693.1 acyltransferase family protein [Kiritimatiellia bacterium]